MKPIKISVEITKFDHVITKSAKGANIMIINLDTSNLKSSKDGKKKYLKLVGWENKEKREFTTHYLKRDFGKDDKPTDEQKNHFWGDLSLPEDVNPIFPEQVKEIDVEPIKTEEDGSDLPF